MKIKRILPLLLSFGILAGCGNGAKTAESNSSIPTEIKNPVEITFWHAMSGAQEETLKKMTDDFMSKNSKIKVKLQNQSSYNDLQQKITATLSSKKNLPTMTQGYANWMLEAINDNLVLDLKPYINNEKLKFDNYNDILPGLRSGVEMNGKIYGMPFNKSTEVIWYNKTLFDELKLKVPTTYEEFAETAKTIHDKKGIVGAGFDSLNNFYVTYLKNNGKEFDSKLDVTGTESKAAADYYLKGIKEGYFRIAGTDKYLSGPLTSEKIGMYIGSNAGESFVKKGAAGKFEVGVAPYPAEKEFQQGTDLYVFSNGTAEQKTAAYEYIKFLTTKENQITWASATGYMPIRQSAIDSDEYKNSGSLIAKILSEATKNLFVNPTTDGSQSAYNEISTVFEGILSDPNGDINKKLDDFKSTLSTTWQ